MSASSQENVLLFVPNLIGYTRLGLLAAAWIFFSNPPLFLGLYVTSVILDGLDGIAARKLKQVSVFGAWLDVTIDNLGRGMVWSLLYEMKVMTGGLIHTGMTPNVFTIPRANATLLDPQWGYFVSAVEWLVFVCTHSLGAAWKNSSHRDPPFWVKAVMGNGFKTPAGMVAITGLHVLPIWIYGYQRGVWEVWIPRHIELAISGLLVSGRMLCMAVELWFIKDHIQNLVADHKQVSTTEKPEATGSG